MVTSGQGEGHARAGREVEVTLPQKYHIYFCVTDCFTCALPGKLKEKKGGGERRGKTNISRPYTQAHPIKNAQGLEEALP